MFTPVFFLFFIVRRRPQIDIEEYNFLEKIFAKSKPEKRTWAKLVNLNTVQWYYNDPEPTPAAIKYEERTCQRKSINPFCLIGLFLWPTYPSSFSEMDDVKRRAAIRLQATKNNEVDVDAMGMGSSKPSAKRRPLLKGDRAPKKQKVSSEPVLGLMAKGAKTMTPAKHGGGKGLMIPPPGSQKKPLVLLREDPKYALEKLSSIIGSEDYEDLGNHSMEPMGETGLFSIAQVNVHRALARLYSLSETNSYTFQAMLITKGLMERSLHHEMALGWVREKAKLAEEELFELKNWRLVTEQKLNLAEQARDEFHKLTEELKKTLKDKEKEVRQAKKVAVLEYRNSDTLISELEVSYNDGFDDALHQVKALYPELDLSSVNISIPEPTSVHPDQSEDTNELFEEDVPITNAPVVLTVEEESKNEEACQAKESVIPDTSWTNFL